MFNELFWATHTIELGKTLELQLGSLRVWIHRGGRDWHIAHQTEVAEESRCTVALSDRPFDPGHDWKRWILDDQIDRVRLRPQLPGRSIIVRPEMPMCLMPKQSARFYVGIPIWLAVTFGVKDERVVDIPSMPLSNSWFGPFTEGEGELCYAIKTTAKVRREDLLPSAQRAIFPLEIRNMSQEVLQFERLCLRPQYLNIFQGETRLWTSPGRVSYRGADNWSRIVYSAKPPEYDNAGPLLGKARQPMQHGKMLKTFDNLRQRVEL